MKNTYLSKHKYIIPRFGLGIETILHDRKRGNCKMRQRTNLSFEFLKLKKKNSKLSFF